MHMPGRGSNGPLQQEPTHHGLQCTYTRVRARTCPSPKTAPMHANTPHARKRTHLRLVGLARTQHLTSPSLLLSAGMRARAVWGRHVRSTCLEQGRRVRGQAARAIASRTHNDANLVRCTSESARAHHAHPAPLPPNLTWTPPFARKTLKLRRELETDVVHTYTHARAQKCTRTQAHTPCQLPLRASRACDPLRCALCLCWQGRATYCDHERERGFWEWRGGSFGMREHTRVRVILRLSHNAHRCHNAKHHAAFVLEDTLVRI